MGFRFRRSINLGGGFRINISKSGIGYSWGGKGFRYTKTAKGRSRATVNFGHGLSYSQDFGGSHRRANRGAKHSSNNSAGSVAQQNNIYETEYIQNRVTSSMISEDLEHLLAATKRSVLIDVLANVLLWISAIYAFILFFIIVSDVSEIWMIVLFILLAIGSVALKVIVRVKGIIELDYNIDEKVVPDFNGIINPILNILKSKKVWRIDTIANVIQSKYASGAKSSVTRTSCKVSERAFPFKTNAPCVAFKSNKETIIILPDKIFLIRGIRVGALDYRDVQINIEKIKFVEKEQVPRDSIIVEKTWQYVNKSGGPDTRFKNNRQYPVCLYGQLHFYSEKGLNTMIMYSNPN